MNYSSVILGWLAFSVLIVSVLSVVGLLAMGVLWLATAVP